MTHGIAGIAVVPMRMEPDHPSEMVSQLIFGETFCIFEKHQDWLHIRSDWDGYEGWICRNACIELSPDEHRKLPVESAVYCTNPLTPVVLSDKKETVWLPFGSRLPFLGSDMKSFQLGGFRYDLPDSCSLSTNIERDLRNSVIRFAGTLLYAPYLWGGKTYFGTDCSGFVQTIFRVHHISLPRDAREQAITGDTVNMLTQAQPGDLAFFDNENS